MTDKAKLAELEAAMKAAECLRWDSPFNRHPMVRLGKALVAYHDIPKEETSSPPTT